MKHTSLMHKFVEYIPDELEEGTIYVSTTFATVAHKCCCGCGEEVVTPLSPTDWKLTYDGEAISLVPSIGNWSLPCRSHYWIVSNSVRMAEQWSHDEIAACRSHDALVKKHRYKAADRPAVPESATNSQTPRRGRSKLAVFRRLTKLLSRLTPSG